MEKVQRILTYIAIIGIVAVIAYLWSSPEDYNAQNCRVTGYQEDCVTPLEK
jgi:hypothetical protein